MYAMGMYGTGMKEQEICERALEPTIDRTVPV